MIILRPIKKSDFDGFIKLVNQDTLLDLQYFRDTPILEQKLFSSINSFKNDIKTPENELYLFVLEDTHTQELLGISAIAATTGNGDPLYFFRHEIQTSNSPLHQAIKKISILTPISYVRGPSEVCSLYLDPKFRSHGLGKLLSLGRFLFVAKFKERFTNSIVALLRGKIDNKISVFWDGIGRHFFDVPITEAVELLKFGRNFISHFLPKHPIYVSLLSKEVQDVIGQTHPLTSGALNLLLQQGFKITDEIDVFDGGPKLSAMKNDVKVISESLVFQIIEISNTLENSDKYLLSNEKLDFRATFGDFISIDENNGKITTEAAEALQIGLGDKIRAYKLPSKG